GVERVGEARVARRTGGRTRLRWHAGSHYLQSRSAERSRHCAPARLAAPCGISSAARAPLRHRSVPRARRPPDALRLPRRRLAGGAAAADTKGALEAAIPAPLGPIR